MKKARNTILALALAAIHALAPAQMPIARGQAPGGEAWLMGGVGQEEVAVMQVARPSFSLSLRTATRSGAFVADVRVRITDADERLVFDQELSGPWLLIDLQPGRYTLEGARRGELHQQAVTVPASGGRDVVLLFEDKPEGHPGDPVQFPPAAR